MNSHWLKENPNIPLEHNRQPPNPQIEGNSFVNRCFFWVWVFQGYVGKLFDWCFVTDLVMKKTEEGQPELRLEI